MTSGKPGASRWTRSPAQAGRPRRPKRRTESHRRPAQTPGRNHPAAAGAPDRLVAGPAPLPQGPAAPLEGGRAARVAVVGAEVFDPVLLLPDARRDVRPDDPVLDTGADRRAGLAGP